MAVGFKLSNVLSFEITDHDTIIVTTKHIVYEMDFDDLKRADEMVVLMSQLTANIKKREKAKNDGLVQKRKSFYSGETRSDEL